MTLHSKELYIQQKCALVRVNIVPPGAYEGEGTYKNSLVPRPLPVFQRYIENWEWLGGEAIQ